MHIDFVVFQIGFPGKAVFAVSAGIFFDASVEYGDVIFQERRRDEFSATNLVRFRIDCVTFKLGIFMVFHVDFQAAQGFQPLIANRTAHSFRAMASFLVDFQLIVRTECFLTVLDVASEWPFQAML
jgi:hypothetical protein